MASVRTVMVTSLLLAGLSVGVNRAGAQIVPPPTAAPPKTPDYVPPPPQAANPPTINAQPPKPKAPEPLVFEYSHLAQRDAAGKLIPLKQPMHRLALERNPFITNEPNGKVAVFLAERDGQLERLVQANMDVILKVDDDGFAKVDAKDTKEEIKALKAMSEPLRLPGGDMTGAMKKAGVLDEKQARANQKIVQDYTKELFADIAAEKERIKKEKEAAGGDKKDGARPSGMSSARMVYVLQVEETMDAYHRLLGEAAKNPAKFAPAAAASVSAAKDDAGKLDAMRKFMIGVGPGPAADVIKSVIAARGK